MTQSESSIEIAKPAGAVFAFINDFSQAKSWLESCVELKQTSAGPRAAGSTLHYLYSEGGRSKEMDGVVTAYEKDRTLSMTLKDSQFETGISFTLEQASAATVVKHSIVIVSKGLFGKIMSGLIAAGNRRQIQNNLSRLKSCVERNP